MHNIPDKYTLWLALADLFFLDTEPDEEDYQRVADVLKTAGWNKEYTKSALILIAPSVKANLGGVIYSVIGNWSGFDKESLGKRIERRESLREKYPNWYFFLQDVHSKWMLKKLGMQRLLDKL